VAIVVVMDLAVAIAGRLFHHGDDCFVAYVWKSAKIDFADGWLKSAVAQVALLRQTA